MCRGTMARWLIAMSVVLGSVWTQLHAASFAPAAYADAGDRPTANAAATPLAAIGDYVWYDADGDGIEDVGEPGIANVQLALYRDDDGSGTITAGDTLMMTTVTGADGGYLFAGLEDGVYLVQVLSAGAAGGPLDGLVHVVGNQSQPEPTAPINVSGGYVYRDADFGYRRVPAGGQAIVGGRVWYDGNADQLQQPGEPGMGGVQICATPSGGGAATCATSDPAGRYLLAVPFGSYAIAPAGGVPAGVTLSTPSPRIVVAAAGQQILNVGFGYREAAAGQLGAIGNLVFRDANGNGIFDAGDAALAGVSVELIRDSNGNRTWDVGEPIIATAVTSSTLDASSGNYRFVGVPAGNYLVHVSATNAILVDFDPSPPGTPGADGHSQADPYPVALAAGASVLTADFGYRPAGVADSGVIGDLIWVESDGDGRFGASDVGQAGVTVELSQNNEVIAATTSGAGGRYSFVRLPAGTYALQVSDDFGVLVGLAPTVMGAAPGQDNNNQTRPYTVTLAAGQYDYTADFGFYRVGRAGAIGDLIWYDADGDGIEDLDERGIPNVRVAAYLDTNSNGFLDAADILMASAVTDAAGGYLLMGLPAGTYFVDVMDAANPDGPLAGMAHSVGNQSQPDPTAAINLGPGQIYKDADFGYRKEPAAGKVVVGDLVWFDGDGDGQRTAAEPGAWGVTVVITDAYGSRVATGITDAAGRYLIEAPAGNGYTVGIDWAASPSVAGLRLTTPSAIYLPPLAAGQQWMAARLGVGEATAAAAGAQGTLLGAIGNLVFNDADRNGRFGAGDSPLPGVTVALIRDNNGNRDWDVGEPIVATAVTSSTLDAGSGNYRFVGVPAGNYLVHVSDTAAVLADYARGPLGAAGSDGNSQADPYAVTLAAGASHMAADFGFYRATGSMAGVIGNLVWGETDGNGLFSPAAGDTGLAGVTVALLQDGETIATTTTGAGGAYAFVGRADGAYQVAVSDDFGVLAGAAPAAPGPFPGQDNNNQAQPYTVTLAGSGINPTADFGYKTGRTADEAGARYAIGMSDLPDTRPGATISFTIRITNTGTAWIVYLPLELTYQTAYLSYLNATPASDDNADDGLIRWRDLVASYGALAPGAAVQVVANFTARADTSRLPGMRTVVTAAGRGVWANPAGPGLLGDLVLIGDRSATAGVRILQPTGLTVLDLAARGTPDGIEVSWRTANEAQILGFDVLRRSAAGSNGGAWRTITPSLIVAEHAGANQGSAYAYLDAMATAGERYEYALAVWQLDGSKAMFGPVAASR